MIVLVGFMGAGKSTVGPLLADCLGLPFADLDAVIEEQRGRTVREIFATGGEPGFRAVEHEALAAFLRGPDAVLALGGGAAEHAASRPLLRAATVVYLSVDYAEALRRVGGDAGRPMLARPDLAEVYQRRLACYQEVASLTVRTDGQDTAAVCQEVLAGLPQARTAGYSHY